MLANTINCQCKLGVKEGQREQILNQRHREIWLYASQENGEDNSSTISEYILCQTNHLAYVDPLAPSKSNLFNIYYIKI